MQRFGQSSPLVSQSYNSLQDEHLVEYYASPHRRRHLRRMGLITKDGTLVDEMTFQRKALKKEQNRRYREAMATSTAARDREAQQQQRAELKKKLEALAKYETVQRIKKEKLHPLGVQTYHPNKTLPAPGQTASILGQTTPVPDTFPDPHLSRILETHKNRITFSPEELKEFKQLVETVTGARTTLLSNKIVPRPPSSPKPKNQSFRVESGHTVRRRPHTAPTKMHRHLTRKTAGESVQEQTVVKVTLCYLGTSKAVKKRQKRKAQLKRPPTEVIVQQQARGYTPLPVYKGQVIPGDSFTFNSIRHPGMPFALVIYTGGMIDCRVSVCCEHRHRAGTLLGGRYARFKVVAIEGGSPCIQCRVPREGKSKPVKPTAVYESTDSESEEHPMSTPQLTTVLQPTQFDISLEQESMGGERGEEGAGNSLSPVSSLYSASLQSESPQPSSDDDREDQQPQRGRHNSSSSEHLVSASSEEEADNGLGQSLTTKVVENSVSAVSVEKQNSVEEERNDNQEGCENQPALVTKGGVTIVYALGPVSTSESATQTEITSTSLNETTTAQDGDNSSVEPGAESSKGNAEDESLEQKKEEEITVEKETYEAEGEQEVEMKLSIQGTNDDEHSGVTVPSVEQDEPTVSETKVESPVTKEDVKHEDLEQVNSEEQGNSEAVQQTQPTLQVSESLSSSESSSEHQPLQNEPRDRELESTSTLTHVSERKNSTSDSTNGSESASLSPSASGSQAALMAETDAAKDLETPGNRSGNQGAGSSEDGNCTGEHCTVLREEEFTKAWN